VSAHETCGLRRASFGQIHATMGDTDHAAAARHRLRAAEERAQRAEHRVEEARRELEDADAAARAALEREMTMHQLAADTHRRAARLQREHLEHAERSAT
jgi:hypothetical protein